MATSRKVVPAIVSLALLLVLLALAVRQPGRQVAGQYATRNADIMFTRVAVTAPTADLERAGNLVFEIFDDVDQRMSEWKETSPLSEVNRRAGQGPVQVPADLRELINRGIEIGDLTDGAFDVTWAALWGLWDFKSAQPTIPGAEEIQRRLDLIDYRMVEVDDQAGTVFLPEAGMLIGLGGIAKGHALDRAADGLRASGIGSFLVSAGGQMMAGGMNGDRPWRIGIRDPRGGAEDYFAFLEVTDTSVSTSGDYERYFTLDGVRYHHILDPRTGWPGRGLRSATVVTADATLADALSTALMILGPDRGLRLVDRLEGVDALLVDGDGRIMTSAGLASRLSVLRSPAD